MNILRNSLSSQNSRSNANGGDGSKLGQLISKLGAVKELKEWPNRKRQFFASEMNRKAADMDASLQNLGVMRGLNYFGAPALVSNRAFAKRWWFINSASETIGSAPSFFWLPRNEKLSVGEKGETFFPHSRCGTFTSLFPNVTTFMAASSY